MSKNYFSIEYQNQCYSPVLLADSDGKPTFAEFLDMTYEEMKNSEKLEDFVIAAMEAADRKSGGEDDYSDVVVTLIGEDGFFIWGIIMSSEGDDITYKVVDWKADGKHFKYAD